jgi:RNase P protein component
MNHGVAVIVKPGPENEMMSFEELKKDLITLFRNAGVLNGGS